MLQKTFDLIKELEFYDMKQANYYPKISFGFDWAVHFAGYSDPKKVKSVLKKMMKVILYSMDFQLDEDYFTSTVVKPAQRIYDKSNMATLDTATEYAHKITSESFINSQEVRRWIGSITQADLQTYFTDFLEDVTVTCVAIGNLKKTHAIRYSQIIKDKLLRRGTQIRNEERTSQTTESAGTMKLPPGHTYLIRGDSANPEDATSAVYVGFHFSGRQVCFCREEFC